jgi:SAM-dependent methyltransferase
MSLIEAAAPDPQASIIDVGGGESTLVDDLIARGYRQVTVLDISGIALAHARQRMGALAESIRWIQADAAQSPLASRAFDVWHDRAVFHFLTSPAVRAAYVEEAARALKQDGHLIVSTFGPQGPEKCSGLDVMRYDAADLQSALGDRFKLLAHSMELHETPFGTTQQFLYCHFRLDEARSSVAPNTFLP